VALLLCALAGAPQVACVGPHVFGGMPPTSFQFTTVVPHRGSPGEPGGWQAAQVLILLGRLSPMFPEAASCDIEVGMPVVNLVNPISTRVAQLRAAEAANEAARRVFQQRLPTAALCLRFREEMQRAMNAPDEQTNQYSPVVGTRVTAFKSLGLSPTTFP
jgi:hypothetical protein